VGVWCGRWGWRVAVGWLGGVGGSVAGGVWCCGVAVGGGGWVLGVVVCLCFCVWGCCCGFVVLVVVLVGFGGCLCVVFCVGFCGVLLVFGVLGC
ncbi:hypothetical protein, partial [Acinetobacter baumannii]